MHRLQKLQQLQALQCRREMWKVQVTLRLTFCFLVLALPLYATPRTPEQIATEILAPLIDPVKVATLKGDRPINTRLYKVLYWLETARASGGNVSKVIDIAQVTAKYSGTAMADADKAAIVRNRENLEILGCLTAEGLVKLRTGATPTITKGEHAGDSIALDHILPRALVPELAAKFYNLDAIPSQVNLAKSANVTAREVSLAQRWQREGLLSSKGLAAVEAGVK